MSDTTTEQIEPTAETLKNEPTLADVMKAISHLSHKVDTISERLDAHDVQFEAIRSGIAASNIAFERLASKVYLISANLAEMQEEARHRSLV